MIVNDFFYLHGERIERLLSILEKEQADEHQKQRCFNPVDLQIHMFLVSAKILEEEEVCIFGDLILKKRAEMQEEDVADDCKDAKVIKKKTLAKDTKLFKLLKQEVKQLDDPSMSYAIFIERVEASQRNTFYFMSYTNMQVQNPRFLSEFWDFCDEHGVLHEKERRRMAI